MLETEKSPRGRSAGEPGSPGPPSRRPRPSPAAPRVRPGRAARALGSPQRRPSTPSRARRCQPPSGARQARCLRPPRGWGFAPAAAPAASPSPSPWRRAAGPRAGRLHRPSLCERRLLGAAWRAGPGRRARARNSLAAPPEPPDLPGRARGWGGRAAGRRDPARAERHGAAPPPAACSKACREQLLCWLRTPTVSHACLRAAPTVCDPTDPRRARCGPPARLQAPTESRHS